MNDDAGGAPAEAVAIDRGALDRSYAAVDLGSNSFHLIVARAEDGRLRVMDRIKERVALAEGMRQGGVLSEAAQVRALGCLQRFNQRVRHLLAGNVRVVGTNTFRRIREPRAFIRRASNVLGRRIEIVSGHEEARLVYLGVRHDVGKFGQRLLAIDIGGGSTELTHGDAHQPGLCESLALGCVAWSQRFFAGGALSADAFERAVVAAKLELEPIAERVRSLPTDLVVGSSGTVVAVSRVLAAEGWTDGAITADALARVRKRMLAAKHVDKVELDGLKANRRPVIAGGVAILIAVLDVLRLESVGVSHGALREGVLVDLLDRGIDGDDPREGAVDALAAQFRVDGNQSARVAETAHRLFDAAREAWRLSDEDAKFLRWAARLHELGLAISHNDYHKHGAYLAHNADLAGFSRDEQGQLGALIYNHRRKLRDEQLGRSADEVEHNLRLALLLRIAVHLHRARSGQSLPPLALSVDARGLALGIPGDWLAEHPLTEADLANEASAWRVVGYTLERGSQPGG